ncbi:prim-pol domain-containing protein [Neoconidiobolus thromboides FSU 785]|nr:prim-pol domain-containing protein [Neoconidiobolus thromboides FSU 785]
MDSSPETTKRSYSFDGEEGDKIENKVIRNDLIHSLDYETLNKLYYLHLFPYHHIYRWLNYGMKETKNFINREFSFTLENDIYLRYQSFDNEIQFKDRILRTLPKKMDIGAVYSIKPSDKKMINSNNFIPLEKELVFDIDLTDYDQVRTCCSGADICLKCWKFITLAVKVLHQILTEDFGFEHILWVYSGRRGVHGWVCDNRARKLNNESRKAIMNYIDIHRNNNNSERKVNLGLNLYPRFETMKEYIEYQFQDIIIQEQQLFSNRKRELIAKCLPEENLYLDLLDEWNKNNSNNSQQNWYLLEKFIENKLKLYKNKKINNSLLSTLLRDIKFQSVYPRLDTNVTININHLLKAPFCIHPSTRRICVPIAIEDIDHFNPLDVPTDSQLINEMNNYSGEHVKNEVFKTSLFKYVKLFNHFIDNTVRSQSEQAKNLDKDLEF